VNNVMRVVGGKWWKDQNEKEYKRLLNVTVTSYKTEVEIQKILKDVAQKSTK